jgi:hypothetical protein
MPCKMELCTNIGYNDVWPVSQSVTRSVLIILRVYGFVVVFMIWQELELCKGV